MSVFAMAWDAVVSIEDCNGSSAVVSTGRTDFATIVEAESLNLAKDEQIRLLPTPWKHDRIFANSASIKPDIRSGTSSAELTPESIRN